MQSKKMSMVETVVNAITSYAVALVMNYYFVPLIYPAVKPTVRGSAVLTILFTVVSMMRTYTFRRIFAWLEYRHEHHRLP